MDVLAGLLLALAILAISGFVTLLLLGLARRGAKRAKQAVIPASAETNHDPFGALNPAAKQPEKESLLLPVDTNLLFRIGGWGFLFCAVLTALVLIPPLFSEGDYEDNLGWGLLFVLITVVGMIGFGVMALAAFFVNAAKSAKAKRRR